MDSILAAKLSERSRHFEPAETSTSDMRIEFLNPHTGEIALVHDDERETYCLQPLAQLYGPGNGISPDPKNELFTPLFLAIEEEIVKHDGNRQRLTDGTVALALDVLADKPEATSTDPLVENIQLALRMTLSLNNYSRQEVRQALRKIGKSVQRHMESGKGRAYVNFIASFFGRA